jgi:hypothetical protein
MKLVANKKEFFALIKYDHEEVVSYDIKKDGIAILKEIKEGLTKAKEALHKSAFISLNDKSGDLIIIDRTVQYDISDFFKKFLNVKRKHSKKGMTKAVQAAVVKTAISHSNDLPHEKTSKIRDNAYEVAKAETVFKKGDYPDKIFGPQSTEIMKKIKKTFNKELKKRGIEDESFKLDHTAITQPKVIKYRTQEGVRIQYDQDAEDKVKIKWGSDDKETTITITTKKLIEE